MRTAGKFSRRWHLLILLTALFTVAFLGYGVLAASTSEGVSSKGGNVTHLADLRFDLAKGDIQVVFGKIEGTLSVISGEREPVSIYPNQEIIITQDQAESTDHTILVAAGVSVRFQLRGINISTNSNKSKSPFVIDKGADVSVSLLDENTLLAAPGANGIQMGQGASLQIDTLKGYTGSFRITGGMDCAGIGTNLPGIPYSLSIAGGNISISGGRNGAGIQMEKGSRLQITGGQIRAYGGQSAAGIGGNKGKDCSSEITISGGFVGAVGGSGGPGAYGGGSPFEENGLILAEGGNIVGNGNARFVTKAGTTAYPIQITLKAEKTSSFLGAKIYIPQEDYLAYAQSDGSATLRLSKGDHFFTFRHGVYSDGRTLQVGESGSQEEIWMRQASVEVLPLVLPSARANKPYSVQLRAFGNGNASYQFRLDPSGNCPEGIALSPEGVLSGVPTKAGSYTIVFWVQEGSSESGSFFTLPFLVEKGESGSALVNIQVSPAPSFNWGNIPFRIVASETFMENSGNIQVLSRKYALTASSDAPDVYSDYSGPIPVAEGQWYVHLKWLFLSEGASDPFEVNRVFGPYSLDLSPPHIVKGSFQLESQNADSFSVGATAMDSLSGVEGYMWAIGEEAPFENTNWQEEGSHLFAGLTQGKRYPVWLKVKDAAGNETEWTMLGNGQSIPLSESSSRSSSSFLESSSRSSSNTSSQGSETTDSSKESSLPGNSSTGSVLSVAPENFYPGKTSSASSFNREGSSSSTATSNQTQEPPSKPESSSYFSKEEVSSGSFSKEKGSSSKEAPLSSKEPLDGRQVGEVSSVAEPKEPLNSWPELTNSFPDSTWVQGNDPRGGEEQARGLIILGAAAVVSVPVYFGISYLLRKYK